MKITLSTCFYKIHSKFDVGTYTNWARNLFKITVRFGLVVYTDTESMKYLPPIPPDAHIKVIVFPFTEFYNYRYKEYWILNHEKNDLLNKRTCWELNMIWAEKISFVEKTATENPYETEFFGWCDIGYFRDGSIDLIGWPSDDIIKSLNKNKIHYAQICYDPMIENAVNNKNEYDLPRLPIPADQVSFAGGFFISHGKKIGWWKETFDKRLHSYFIHGYLVKDDQIIIADCIYSDPDNFQIHTEDIDGCDHWFMFQRLLMNP